MDIVTLTLAKKGAKKYTDEVVEGLGKGIVYKGAVNYYNDLPDNATQGDCYSVLYKGTSGTDPSGLEYVWGKIDGQGSASWIQLGADIDLTDYVKNNDYATNNKGGVVKVGVNGVSLNDSKQLQAGIATYEEYEYKSNTYFISKGTLNNILTEKIGNVEELLENLDTGNGVE